MDSQQLRDLRAALLFLLAAGAALSLCGTPQQPVPVTSQHKPPPGKATCEPCPQHIPSVWASDGDAPAPLAGLPGVDVPVPSSPFAGQKTPPCTRNVEQAINGGCWFPHKQMPPCTDGLYRHGNACYLPVRRAERPPMSGEADLPDNLGNKR